MTGQKTVLLVEDDLVIAHDWRRVLEQSGYVVMHSKNAETGFEICLKNWPDAVVIDFFFRDEEGALTGEGGLSFATKMHVHATMQELKLPVVIAVTASRPTQYFPIDVFSQMSSAYVPVRIRKPFTPEQLRDTLETALNERKQA